MHEFSSEERPYENDEEEAENVAQKEESISSPHLNPDWLKHLKANCGRSVLYESKTGG